MNSPFRSHAGTSAAGTSSCTPEEVLRHLTPDAVTALAGLDRAPESVAQVVVQMLPFGTRAVFERLELVTGVPPMNGRPFRRLTLLPLAYEVMAVAAARRGEVRTESVQRWQREVEFAAGRRAGGAVRSTRPGRLR